MRQNIRVDKNYIYSDSTKKKEKKKELAPKWAVDGAGTDFGMYGNLGKRKVNKS